MYAAWEEGLALLNGKVIDPANLPSQIDGDGLDDLDVLSDFDIDEGSADDEITLASERICSKDMHHSLPQSALALTSVIDSEADITEESIDFIDDDLAGSTTPSDTGRASCKAATKELDTSQAILLKGIAHRTYVPTMLASSAFASCTQLASSTVLLVHRHCRVCAPQ